MSIGPSRVLMGRPQKLSQDSISPCALASSQTQSADAQAAVGGDTEHVSSKLLCPQMIFLGGS
ncbi:hypothetical protein N7533_004165 [Penicillium manginii]|uniref:uncharacterized protein n=1 Tax=Penicillium manginii TaxID=203109 RepID=UPI002548BE25|nr:uncharacterized protein N7533_004165 [Penicillium manginii]KAJ5754622.1 hypothetical protein N7533_004165 [Penicillium manginii]